MQDTQIKSNKELDDFIRAIGVTIDNHLQYVEDDDTKTRWDDLVCNGITSSKSITVTSLARMLDITNEVDSQNMGTVIQILFDSLPVLQNYWDLTKVNLKSAYVRRLHIIDNKKLLSKLDKQKELSTKKTVQMTLTQPELKIKPTSDSVQQDQPQSTETKEIQLLKEGIFTQQDEGENFRATDKEDEEGFTQPKRTVPFAKASANYDQTFASISAGNKNSFAKLAVDLATDMDSETNVSNQASVNQSEDDNSKNKGLDLKVAANEGKKEMIKQTESQDDSLVSYSESSGSTKQDTPSKCTIVITPEMYDAVTQIVNNGSHNELSEEILTEWIESKIKHVADTKITQSAQMADRLKEKVHRYMDNDFQKLKTALKKCQVEYEIAAMRTINKDFGEVEDQVTKTKQRLREYTDELEYVLKQEVENHKQTLGMIREDFMTQCKDFLQDHILHRREIFTNQKAGFNNEINNMKNDMERYMQNLQTTKIDLEENVQSLRATVEVYKAEIEDLRHLRFTSKSPIPEQNAPNSIVHEPVMENTPRVNNERPSVPEHIHTPTPAATPLPNYSRVKVRGEGINISNAAIRNHYYESGELWYEIATSRSIYKFPSDNVVLVDNQDRSVHDTDHHHNQRNNRTYRRDDASISSSFTNEHQQRRNNFKRSSQTDLMPNQYRYNKQPDVIYIQATKMLQHAANWKLKWTDDSTDPKDFYESLRSRIEFYGIMLKPYIALTRDATISVLNEFNCENFENAGTEMSKSLYTVLDTFQKDWFESNPKQNLKLEYEDNRDGFGLLKEMVKEYHPNLREKTQCETMDKPCIENAETWFQYMKTYRRWVEFEATSPAQRTYTDNEHVSNILKQISDIEVFSVAKQKIEQEMAIVHAELQPFPEKYKLKNIGLTINEFLPKDAQRQLPSYDANTSRTINKVNRDFKKKNDKEKSDKCVIIDKEKPSREWADVICPACGLAGHHIDYHGCDQMAIDINLQKFKKSKRNTFDGKTVVDIFKDHQQQKKNKRQSGKQNRKKRNMLRRQLRAAKVELGHDHEQYQEAKELYIKAFKNEYKEFDLTDPNQNHNYEVKEYDVLESESEESVITEEV